MDPSTVNAYVSSAGPCDAPRPSFDQEIMMEVYGLVLPFFPFPKK